MTVTGIQEAGHTEIQPLLCCVEEAVPVMNGLALLSRILLLTDTTGEALDFPLNHICFMHCLHCQIPV